MILGMLFGSRARPLQGVLAKMSQEAFTAVIDDKAKVEDLDQALENIDGHFKELGKALTDLWSEDNVAAKSLAPSWASYIG